MRCLLVLIGVSVLLIPIVAHADSPPTPTPVASTPVASTPVATTPTAPRGIPAITPEPQLRARALAVAGTAAYSTTATYTAADVRDYLSSHALFRTTDGSAPIIDAIEFVPAAEASALLRGESIGRPDTTLVCFVKVHGPLIVLRSAPLPMHHPHPVSAKTPMPVGELIFDAQTGNLLIRGYLY